jgi:hypothetical protein
MPGAIAEDARADESRDGRGRAKHDCRDAGGRAMPGAIAEDARADESRDGRGRAKHDARADADGRVKT